MPLLQAQSGIKIHQQAGQREVGRGGSRQNGISFHQHHLAETIPSSSLCQKMRVGRAGEPGARQEPRFLS